MIRPTLLRSILAITASLAMIGCEAPSALGPQGDLGDLVTRVATSDGTTVATYHTGAPPAADGGAAPSTAGTGSVVNGGTALLTVSAASEFTTVLVSGNGLDGYYQLTLPSSAAQGLVLGIAQGADAAELSLRVSVGSGSDISPSASQDLTIHHVGTGDVQVSVSWTGASDVDIRVTDPNGELVYFGNPTSASGGALDLDSNAGCTIDGANSENVVWPAGKAPHGDYKVVLAYHDDCGVARSDYVVTVSIAGHQPQVITGAFVGAFDANPDKQVGTFTY